MKKIVYLFIISIVFSCNQEPENTKISGPVFGTAYNIQYYTTDDSDYKIQFDSLFAVINESMSTYIPDSKISRINKGESVELDAHFTRVFNKSKEIYRATEGAFDPTIGSVVNAWDFGPEGKITNIDSTTIDSLMRAVGYNRMGLRDNKIVKSSKSFLDFNAIAKGYGVDVIGEFLESKNVTDYLVEIGGEIRVRGINLDKKSPWKVGIDDPNFEGEQSYSKVIPLQDEAMATSGTYRKFKIDDNGNRYAHIIDTKTGYPSKTNILSVSVLAEDCMTADAYATAFQAMGVEKVKAFTERHSELKVFIIFENEAKELETLSLNNFPQ
ncbi:Thiamin biosynthesis lipoprotein ApbE [Winogradskyella psychrotolerans RS-3]|uniref:FAD:protein FMN transferase n=1 Tax=Winogradskyella psychrotolerans RS-3 TaxID=641526 RepID=S7VVS3_9FLAO|nr:FAD:protein FMN transferase [Winogradskyella psychrotolerans]EPR74186.1 Thiamin biosynthesis lipoprotein ApbE [Winogradskyella psychrotolerans RS-3]